MDRLEAMSILIAVAEAGSLSAASRRLGTPLPTVSRKIAELEANGYPWPQTIFDAGDQWRADPIAHPLAVHGQLRQADVITTRPPRALRNEGESIGRLAHDSRSTDHAERAGRAH